MKKSRRQASCRHDRQRHRRARRRTTSSRTSALCLYGFPESHAASFALIAYASAYFKVKYLAAFTCAILNNQPMGFYMPAVLVKDAQRHGLRIKPIEFRSQSGHAPSSMNPMASSLVCAWVSVTPKACANKPQKLSSHLAAQAGLFRSAEDLALRVPSLEQKGLTLLAHIGALNRWTESRIAAMRSGR